MKTPIEIIDELLAELKPTRAESLEERMAGVASRQALALARERILEVGPAAVGGLAPDSDQARAAVLNALVRDVRRRNIEKGFVDPGAPRDPLVLLMLIVTELAEAAECYRDNEVLSELRFEPSGKPAGFPSELADVFIRLCDLAGECDVDLGAAIAEKERYNWTREPRHGGKKA